jgi:hypothetical protein
MADYDAACMDSMRKIRNAYRILAEKPGKCPLRDRERDVRITL